MKEDKVWSARDIFCALKEGVLAARLF